MDPAEKETETSRANRDLEMESPHAQIATSPIHHSEKMSNPVQKCDGSLPDGTAEDATSKTLGAQREKEYDAEAGYITGLRLYLLVLALVLAILCVALDNAILATAIPTITTAFNSLDDVGWYGSSFLIAICALQPTSGSLFKYFSLKWMYLSFIVLFELGSLICGIAVNSNMLIVGRAIAGLGAAGIFSGALTIVAHTIPLRLRPVYIGVIGSVLTIANVLGPIVGGALTQHATWRWCFFINLPFGAITVVVVYLVFHPSKRETDDMTFRQKVKHLDIPGLLIFIPAMIMLLLGVQWGGTQYSWNSATIIGLLCGAGVTLIIFVWWQWHQKEEAGIPPRIASQRSVIFSAVVSFLLFGSLNAGLYFLPIWFQVILGSDPTSSGIHLLPSVLSSMLTGIMSGVLITKIGWYNTFLILGATTLAIGAGLFSTFTTSSGAGAWIGYQVLFGGGAGLGTPVALTAIMAVLPPNDVSIGTSIIVFSQFLGGSIFLSIADSLFTQRLIGNLITNVPDVNSAIVVAAGAAGFRSVISEQDVAGVLLAYNSAIADTFLVAAIGSAVAVLAAFGVEWKNVKGKSMIPVA